MVLTGGSSGVETGLVAGVGSYGSLECRFSERWKGSYKVSWNFEKYWLQEFYILNRYSFG